MLPSTTLFISKASSTQAELGANEAIQPPVPQQASQLSGLLPGAMSMALTALHQECTSQLYKKIVTIFKP